MEVQGTPRRLEAVTEHHLLRIGQEVVANALRHAQAGKIEVLVCYRESEVMLEVKDDGRGFDTKQALDISSGHFGLLGLRERANKLGGKLRIDSRPWAGTAVSLTVPLNIHFPK
jgi:signal transduction histidine kinase